MATPEERLREAGLELPDAPAPVAAYVPAVRSGSLVFTSGQLPWLRGELIAKGKVGSDVDPDTAKEAARYCALNALAAVRSVTGELSVVSRVVKVVGYVASVANFTGQPGVVDGASALIGQAFGDKGAHARSAVGVAALPLDTPVEIELVVEVA